MAMRSSSGGRVWLIALLALALAAVAALPAAAKRPGTNGQILFARFDPTLGDLVAFTVNPDGSHERQLIPGTPIATECPRWSPDGSEIATCGSPLGGSSLIINADTGSYRELPNPDPANLFLPCPLWSSDGGRLACEGFGLTDPSLNGIYTIRSSDGGGLTRVTSNPGGDDNPTDGDYSPDGRRLAFGRYGEDGPVGLFVVNTNGTGLKQITPTGTLLSSDGDWSPQGNEIVFSQHITPDVRSSIWVVHADGTGLHEIPVQAQPVCGGAFSDPTSQGCFGPRWSPDGTKIVFARGTSGDNDSNIYTVNIDGTGLTQVTHGGRDQLPDWGTHLLAK
jgi:TolB protein